MNYCIFGRSGFDPTHPTCASCQEQRVCECEPPKKKRKPRRPYLARPQIENGVKSLTCYCTIDSPNRWTNKKQGQKAYRGIRERWERLFAMYGRGLFGRHNNRPRRLSVIFYVPDGRQKIRDKTNMEGAFKPLEDALTRTGLIYDDTPRWLERLPLQQIIDPELDEPCVSITLTDKEQP